MLGGDLPAARPLTAAIGFDESKHPRHPRGSDKGGEFARKGGAARRSSPTEDRVTAQRAVPETRRSKPYVPTSEQRETQLGIEIEEAGRELREAMESQQEKRLTPRQFLAIAQRYAYLRWPEAFER